MAAFLFRLRDSYVFYNTDDFVLAALRVVRSVRLVFVRTKIADSVYIQSFPFDFISDEEPPNLFESYVLQLDSSAPINAHCRASETSHLT